MPRKGQALQCTTRQVRAKQGQARRAKQGRAGKQAE
jgi:hypothetical protein